MGQVERQDGERLCDYLSRVTMRTLTMETSLHDNLNKCHQQDQSPLFHQLPKEIRDLIFSFATDQYEDLENRYSETAWCYRPGHRGPLKTSTSLLATCRRIWLETSQLPIRNSKVTMWYDRDRGPVFSEQPKYDFARSWTTLNKKNFNTIQIFGQKHMLDRMFSGPRLNWANTKIAPKVLRVTMRHTDWNRWEDPLPLEFNHGWLQRALDNQHLNSIETLQLELETLEVNKDQLWGIIDHLKTIQGRPRSTDPVTELKRSEEPHFWHWKGPPNINDETHAAHAGMDRLEYRVAVLTWKATPCAPGTVPSAVTNTTARVDLFSDPQRIRGPPGPRPLRMADFPTRRRLAQDGWQSMQFPFAQYLIAAQSTTVAQAEEYQRSLMFQKMFADVKARELQQQWEEQDSLLKFEKDASIVYGDLEAMLEEQEIGLLRSMNDQINSFRFDQLVCPPEPSWPPQQLTTWLARHNFAPQWFNAVQSLGVSGHDFVDTIRQSRSRGTGFVPQTLCPQVRREYAAAGIAFRPFDIRQEAQRLRNLVRELVKNWYVYSEGYATAGVLWQS